MAKKIVFSPASIDALKSGSLADDLTPGLSIVSLSKGRKSWRFRRRVARSTVTVTMFGGTFPGVTIADAREWACSLNELVETGIDPREAIRAEQTRATMTVNKAHELYMVAVKEGRSSRAKRPNKTRTIADKLEIYNRDISTTLALSHI